MNRVFANDITHITFRSWLMEEEEEEGHGEEAAETEDDLKDKEGMRGRGEAARGLQTPRRMSDYRL